MDWKKKLDIIEHKDKILPKKNSAKKHETEYETLKEHLDYSLFNKNVCNKEVDSIKEDISNEEDIAAKCNSEDIKNLQMCFFTFFAFIGIITIFLPGNNIPSNTTYLLGMDIHNLYSALQMVNFLLVSAMIPPLFNNIRNNHRFGKSIFGFLPKFGSYKINKLLTAFMITFTATTGITTLNTWGLFNTPTFSNQSSAHKSIDQDQNINPYKTLIDNEHANTQSIIEDVKQREDIKENSMQINRMEALRHLEELKIQEAITIQAIKIQHQEDALNKITNKDMNRTQSEKIRLQKMEEQAKQLIDKIRQDGYNYQAIKAAK